MNITEAQKNFMVESLVKDLSMCVMDDYHTDMEEALSAVINSDTYRLLECPETGLFYQSGRYVYSFLQNELNCGRAM